jgi:hypothetical protein
VSGAFSLGGYTGWCPHRPNQTIIDSDDGGHGDMCSMSAAGEAALAPFPSPLFSSSAPANLHLDH